MDEIDDEFYSFHLREIQGLLGDIEYFLDGNELSEETVEKLDNALDDVETTVERLYQIAEDIFNAANAQA